jgi:hypothetical protein
MQPEVTEPKPAETQPAIIAPPAQQPAALDRAPRVTAQMLVAMEPSERRDNWIAQLVDADVARQHFLQDKALAREFAMSGQFDDLKGLSAEQAIATAMVKIQLGRAWGFNAADSMRYIYFTNGRPSIENEIVAAKLQQAGYDWDTEWLEDEIQHKGKTAKKCNGCTLWLKKWNAAEQRYNSVLDRNGKPVSVSFTLYDADTAQIWEKGKQIPLSQKWNFQSWGRDMYYWRCISRVKKYHAPHVLRGGVSREEALEMMPIESIPPDMLPKELQPPESPQMESEPASPKRPSLRDRLMPKLQPDQAEQPPESEEQEQRKLEGLDQ